MLNIRTVFIFFFSLASIDLVWACSLGIDGGVDYVGDDGRWHFEEVPHDPYQVILEREDYDPGYRYVYSLIDLHEKNSGGVVEPLSDPQHPTLKLGECVDICKESTHSKIELSDSIILYAEADESCN